MCCANRNARGARHWCAVTYTRERARTHTHTRAHTHTHTKTHLLGWLLLGGPWLDAAGGGHSWHQLGRAVAPRRSSSRCGWYLHLRDQVWVVWYGLKAKMYGPTTLLQCINRHAGTMDRAH